MKKLLIATVFGLLTANAFAITSIVTPQSPEDAAAEQAAVEAEARANEPAQVMAAQTKTPLKAKHHKKVKSKNILN